MALYRAGKALCQRIGGRGDGTEGGGPTASPGLNKACGLEPWGEATSSRPPFTLPAPAVGRGGPPSHNPSWQLAEASALHKGIGTSLALEAKLFYPAEQQKRVGGRREGSPPPAAALRNGFAALGGRAGRGGGGGGRHATPEKYLGTGKGPPLPGPGEVLRHWLGPGVKGERLSSVSCY